MILYPYPKEFALTGGLYRGNARDALACRAEFDPSMPPEGYLIEVAEDGIRVAARDELAAFRARATLDQLVAQSEDGLPCLRARDWPDYAHRGVMLDISRSKVPKLSTLFTLVDLFASLKINELQLYIEGFSFAYPSFPEVWRDGTPITGEEIRALDAYCRARHIELIPNQNCFGHMHAWLAHPNYNRFAECPDGFVFEGDGTKWPPFTMAPFDEDGFRHVERMFDDLLPNFTSDTVNIDCDETLDLGLGKSRALCEKLGREKVYRDRLVRTYDFLRSRGKKVMFWGDIIAKAPQLIETLPKDMIALNWGYGYDALSEASCAPFEKAGLPYYNSCGTSSCNSVLGQQDQMLINIQNGCENGLRRGAAGILNTDWGDLNHIHYLPVSYPGFAYGAAMSWNACPKQRTGLCDYLNRFVFRDEAGVMANAVMNAGRFHLLERLQESTNVTYAARTLYTPLSNTPKALPKKSELDLLTAYLDGLKAVFADARMTCEDATVVRDEFANGIEIVKFACLCARYKRGEVTDKAIRDAQERVLSEHRRLWLIRNKPGGLADSLARIAKV